MYTVHCTMYIVQCRVYSLHCTIYSVHKYFETFKTFAVNFRYLAMPIRHYIYNVYCTIYNVLHDVYMYTLSYVLTSEWSSQPLQNITTFIITKFEINIINRISIYSIDIVFYTYSGLLRYDGHIMSMTIFSIHRLDGTVSFTTHRCQSIRIDIRRDSARFHGQRAYFTAVDSN